MELDMSKTIRRELIQLIAVGGAVPLIAGAAQAAERLAESDPIAIALGYKEDATTVDVAAYPKRSGAEGATQFCSNCKLYEEKGDGWGTCTAIAGKLVAGRGWCNAWIPEA